MQECLLKACYFYRLYDIASLKGEEGMSRGSCLAHAAMDVAFKFNYFCNEMDHRRACSAPQVEFCIMLLSPYAE